VARHVEGPWYRQSKGTWYCTANGKSVSLGVRGAGSRKGAEAAWHRLMAGGESKPKPEAKPEPKAAALTVAALVSGFLSDAEGRISSEAFRGYRKFLRPFSAAFGDRPAESITAQEAEAFSRRPDWSSTYQAQFLGTLQSAYRFGVRKRLIGGNPVQCLRKPVKQSRGVKAVINEGDHRRLLAHAKPDTRDLLLLLWHTGARPGEITGLTAEQVKASADGVIPLAEHKTAHKGKSRFLVLSGEALKIARRRAKAVGSGLLFRGQSGGRLTAQAVGCRLKKLCRKAGVRYFIPYGYRHTFATHALAAGVPDAQVAALLGHSSTTMLHRHYSHLTSQAAVLREALAKVR
jgi:integrase